MAKPEMEMAMNPTRIQIMKQMTRNGKKDSNYETVYDIWVADGYGKMLRRTGNIPSIMGLFYHTLGEGSECSMQQLVMRCVSHFPGQTYN